MIENMETEENLDICRLCMTEEDVILFNIFVNTKISDSTVLKIRECIGLKVFLGDGLPSLICHRCSFMLDKFDTFRKMCHRSNTHLMKYHVNAEQSCVDIEEDIEILDDTGRRSENSETSEVMGNNEVSAEVSDEIIDADTMSKGNTSDQNTTYIDNTSSNCLKVTFLKVHPPEKRAKIDEVIPVPESKESHHSLHTAGTSKFLELSSQPSISNKKIQILKLTQGKGIHGIQSLYGSQKGPLQIKNGLNKAKILQIQGKHVKLPTRVVLELSQNTENNTGTLSNTNELENESTEPSNTNHCNQSYEHLNPYHGLLVCSHCDEKFVSVLKLEKHMAVHSTDNRPFKCSQCQKRFTHSWQVLRHENLHSMTSNYTCKICKRNFTSETYLNRHMNIHNKTYVCYVCDQAFSYPYLLEKHKTKAHNIGISKTEDDEVIFIPDDDDDDDVDVRITENSSSANIAELSSGVPKGTTKQNIDEQAVVQMPSCSSEYKDHTEKINSSEVRGTSNDDNGEERTYTCFICRHKFCNIDDLMCHEQSVHNIRKIYPCKSCLKRFTKMSHLMEHCKKCKN